MTEGQGGKSIKVELQVNTLSVAKGPDKIRTMERVLDKLVQEVARTFPESHRFIPHLCPSKITPTLNFGKLRLSTP